MKDFVYKGTAFRFNYEIRQILEYDNGFVIRLDSFEDAGKNIEEAFDNVFFLDTTPKITWRIQNYKEIDDFFDRFYYRNIEKNEESQDTFLATTFTGKRFVVNLIDGKIVGDKKPIR